MSSKGPVAVGTDGSDHLHRQSVASHYQISAVNKSRLRFSIRMHYLITFLMLIKLTDDLLDRFYIFILELQELYIPKPLLWEWIWTCSIVFTFIAKRAMKKNNPNLMKSYVYILCLGTIGPVLYAFAYFFNDFWLFAETRDIKQISMVWNNYPLAHLWYIFLVIALQVHISQLFFAIKLIFAWSVKRQKKE